MTTNADDYVHETHSSSDERRSSGSELDDQDSNADDFFFRRTYTCKSDIVVACSDYNAKAGWAYVVKSISIIVVIVRPVPTRNASSSSILLSEENSGLRRNFAVTRAILPKWTTPLMMRDEH
uniref:AlNc14C111G6395 protein n=1 Tax=Albugo laibachii Nc14 TaxID=890382 RepID=F0WIJ5_9STRA|nr:AlNc14C111G6395 [Albugo laibachii Nc14]|eukprot:CCA21077.1 AlNc14C111G6395 [Albugo laibachii Nc14]